METVPQTSRRKACDLCFIKKIKCDMGKPSCSNCRQYGAACRTTAVRRRYSKVRSQHERANVSATSSSAVTEPPGRTSESRPSPLEQRLARIENQLQQVLTVTSAAVKLMGELPLAGLNNTGGSSQARNVDAFMRQGDANDDTAVDVIAFPASIPASIRECGLETRSALKLPPGNEILPIVNRYFTHINTLIPLFAQPAFMRMLLEWYSNPASRERAAWACINIVLALGSRYPAVPGQDVGLSRHEPGFVRYMSNARSALAELVMRDEDLLGLQVLLGLVILYQAENDSRPAVVLIGAAVRLTHRLRLQSKLDIEALYPPKEGLHRSRLFWITYMLDKEISLRHFTPSVQLDVDTDLDLPPADPADGAGDMHTTDGGARVNYFRLRLRLAHIQGRVYDLLYSNRSSKVSAQEKESRVLRLNQQLESWRSEIPTPMQLGSIATSLGRMELLFMSTLYCGYLFSLVMAHGIWSTRADWLNLLSSHTRAMVLGSESHGHRCFGALNPPTEWAWKHCLGVSRECLTIARTIPPSDCNFWANCPSLITALIAIMCDICEHPGRDTVQQDMRLCRFALSLFHKATEVSILLPLKNMEMMLVELEFAAEMVAENAASEGHAEGENPVLSDLRLSGDGTLATSNTPALWLEGQFDGIDYST